MHHLSDGSLQTHSLYLDRKLLASSIRSRRYLRRDTGEDVAVLRRRQERRAAQTGELRARAEHQQRAPECEEPRELEAVAPDGEGARVHDDDVQRQVREGQVRTRSTPEPRQQQTVVPRFEEVPGVARVIIQVRNDVLRTCARRSTECR